MGVGASPAGSAISGGHMLEPAPEAFLDFLSGPEARAALTRQGFALPD